MGRRGAKGIANLLGIKHHTATGLLGFAVGHHVVGDGVVGTMGLVDGAEGFLILLDVAREGHKEALGVDRRHDDALPDDGAVATREGLRKVEDELGGGMGDDGKIGIGAFSGLVVDAQIEVVGVIVVFFGHNL